MKQMTTKEAIEYLVAEEDLSMYAIAKKLKVSSIMISHYRKGINRMSPQTAEYMKTQFNIEIIDASRRGRASQWKK